MQYPTRKATSEGRAQTLARRAQRNLKHGAVLVNRSGHVSNRTVQA